MSADVIPLDPRTPPADELARLRTSRSWLLFTFGACLLVGVGAGLGTRPGIAALAIVVATLVVLRSPVMGAFALIAVVPEVSGLRHGFPVPGYRLSELMIAGLASLILFTARSGHTPRWLAFDWLALGYVLANAVLGSYDLIARGHEVSLGDAPRLLGPLQFFLLYRAVRTTLISDARRRLALRLMLLASVPVSVLALLQQAHLAGVPSILASITDSQDYIENVGVARATGPFAHWHDLGGYLFPLVLLSVALLAGGSGRVLRRNLLIGVLALAAIGVVDTVSFTPISGVVLGSALLMLARGRSRRWLGGFAAAAALVALLFAPMLQGRYHEQFVTHAPVKERPYLPQNLNFRLAVWNAEFRPVLEKHLVTGYGPRLPPNLAFSFTESVYVTLLLRGGLPLLLLYAGLMLALAAEARRLRHDRDPDTRAVAEVVLIVIVLIVFMQTLTNYFVNAGFPHVFWLLAAILLAGGDRAPRPGPGTHG